MTSVMMNSHTRLFAVKDDLTYKFEYIGWIGVFRVMVSNGIARFILIERYLEDAYYSISRDFEDGDGFDIMIGKITDPRNHDLGRTLWSFRNCHLVRQWMPKAVALMTTHIDALTMWHDFESKEWTYNSD